MRALIGPRVANFHIFKKLKVTLGPLFPSFLRTKGGAFRGASFLSADPPCSGILEYFVGAHSLNILSRLGSLPGGPSGGGYNCWQLRPHGIS